MEIVGTIMSVLLGLGLLGYALSYKSLNSTFTPRNDVPARVTVMGAAGLGFLALPWLL